MATERIEDVDRPDMASCEAQVARMAHVDERTARACITTRIRKIDRLNPTVRAYSHWSPRAVCRRLDTVLAQRRAGAALPLGGLSLAVKGNFPIAGLPWTEGSRLFADRTARRDADCVELLGRLGMIVMGATTLTELAMYAPDNPAEPLALNPWNPVRTPGGSSSGSAVAVALGMAAIGLGTDSGGSGRNPAIHCGVVGFKPTMGRLPRKGLPIYAPSLDTPALIGREVADIRLVMAAMGLPDAGHTNRRPELLVPWSLIEPRCDTVTRDLFSAALDLCARSGMTITPITVGRWEAADAAAGLISQAEGSRALADLDETRLGPALRARKAAGRAISGPDVTAAHRVAHAFGADIAALLRHHPDGVIASPAWPFPAPELDATTIRTASGDTPIDPARNIFVRPANAGDCPALTLPMGHHPNGGVPVGLHLMTACGQDARLLRAAADIAACVAPLHPGSPDISQVLATAPGPF